MKARRNPVTVNLIVHRESKARAVQRLSGGGGGDAFAIAIAERASEREGGDGSSRDDSFA